MSLVIHPSCGEVSLDLQKVLARLWARLAQGRQMHYTSSLGNFWGTRDQYGRLVVTKEPGEVFLPKRSWGPAKWRELHEAAAKMSDEEFATFLPVFSASLPAFCGCRDHWKKILVENPFTSKPFTYSVLVHNAVNQQLGKPLVSLETALTLYPI